MSHDREILFSMDVTAGVDDVVVFERRGDQWMTVYPGGIDMYPAPSLDLPVRWKETICWRDTISGWMEKYLEGEFVLDEDQRAMIARAYERLVDEGKLIVTSTALDFHVQGARS